MAKDQIIQTMVTKEDRDLLQEEADLMGITMSAYLRNLINARQATPIYEVVSKMKGVNRGRSKWNYHYSERLHLTIC